MKKEKASNTPEDSMDDEVTEGKELIPSMNVGLPVVADENKSLIEDDKMLGMFDEVLCNIRQNCNEIDEVLTPLKDMLLNDGDATTSTKEAVVNLLKIKSDSADKMTKVADLMARIYLKETNTFPRYLAASQNNTINITKKEVLTSAEKRALIENEGKKNEGII
jgi:hypothetical protein